MSETPTKMGRPTPIQLPSASHDEVLLRRYRVLERRGRGGFGTVCTCWDTRLQRRVAIKRLSLAQEWGTTVQEALAEARTSCMLSHPNIVTVFDFETDGAFAYLVMEYVDGLNLAELLSRVEGGRLTPDECAHVVQSVGRALSFAHENLVLHLDIKPTNIMIDRQGVVKLADFGMATLASAAGYGGARGGTVGYMPPEQIEGEMVDERTDVFALAAVTWQALTGSNPFLARSAEDSLKRIQRGPGRLFKSCPQLDADVEPELLAALSPSPATRTADVLRFAEELGGDLGSAAEGEASLRELVQQAEGDDAPDQVVRPGGPATLPRLPEGSVARILTALASFACLRLTTPFLLSPEASGASMGMPLLCALASGIWPPLASVLVVGSTSAALIVRSPAGDAASPFLAIAIAAAALLWWGAVGRRDRLSSLGVLLPCCLPSPVAGAAISGYALDPLPSALTAGVGFCLGTVFHAAVSCSFSPVELGSSLTNLVQSPGLWALLVGTVLSAAVSSAAALRGSVGWGIAGQAFGFTLLAGFCVLAASMENNGIWPSVDWSSVVLALLLSVLMCVATVLRGPLYEGQEGEDSDEFSK